MCSLLSLMPAMVLVIPINHTVKYLFPGAKYIILFEPTNELVSLLSDSIHSQPIQYSLLGPDEVKEKDFLSFGPETRY